MHFTIVPGKSDESFWHDFQHKIEIVMLILAVFVVIILIIKYIRSKKNRHSSPYDDTPRSINLTDHDDIIDHRDHRTTERSS